MYKRQRYKKTIIKTIFIDLCYLNKFNEDNYIHNIFI